MSNKNKIFFISPSLVGGGAEKVIIMLLRYLNRDLFSPELITFYNTNDYSSEIPIDVRIRCLNKRSRFDYYRLRRSLANIIKEENPKLIFSTLTDANCLSLLSVGRKAKKPYIFINEQNNPLDIWKMRRIMGRIWKFLVKVLYPKAEGIVCVSLGVKNDLVRNFKLDPEKCHVIFNAVDIDAVTDLAQEKMDHPWFAQEKVPVFTACGRLTPQKNFPLLLRSMSIALTEAKFRLVILGKGEDREKLEAYAHSLGIAEEVAFLGFQQNPFKYIAQATGFVLCSLWEGLPLALIEAMASGTPSIATRCPYGPEEIITDGINGLLVPLDDEKGLAATMARLIKDKALQIRLAEAGKKKAEDFDVKKIVGEYEQLFLKAIKY
jgi:glycosyltransferase involved in cell wall biosynthesis